MQARHVVEFIFNENNVYSEAYKANTSSPPFVCHEPLADVLWEALLAKADVSGLDIKINSRVWDGDRDLDSGHPETWLSVDPLSKYLFYRVEAEKLERSAQEAEERKRNKFLLAPPKDNPHPENPFRQLDEIQWSPRDRHEVFRNRLTERAVQHAWREFLVRSLGQEEDAEYWGLVEEWILPVGRVDLVLCKMDPVYWEPHLKLYELKRCLDGPSIASARRQLQDYKAWLSTHYPEVPVEVYIGGFSLGWGSDKKVNSQRLKSAQQATEAAQEMGINVVEIDNLPKFHSWCENPEEETIDPEDWDCREATTWDTQNELLHAAKREADAESFEEWWFGGEAEYEGFHSGF